MTRLFQYSLYVIFLTTACLNAKTTVQEDKIPDLLLGLDPIAIHENQAVSGLFQLGKRDFRLNGTYAFSLYDQHLFKVSGEFLSEKLGFGFKAGRIHAWVHQYAVGGEYRLCNPYPWFEYIDVGLNYSHAASRQLHLKLVPEENLLNNRRIAGADAVSFQAQSMWTLGKGAIGGALFYDYVRYGRKYQGDKSVTGPGLGINAHYPIWRGTKLHGNVELRRPYLFLEGRVSWNMRFWKMPLGFGLFIESVRGFQELPSSTRFGIQLAFDFGPSKECAAECGEATPTSAAQRFAMMPAVYRPQVLAITDQNVRMFTDGPSLLQNIGELVVPVGSFSFDVSGYFSGGGPLMFFGSNLPDGLAIDPLSGVISGVVDSSAIGTYAAEIAAVNFTGRVTQPVVIRVVP